MAIDVVNEDNSRLSPAVSRGNDPQPDVLGMEHPRLRRFLAFKRVVTTGTAAGLWIKDGLRPRHSIELSLEPLSIFKCGEEHVSDRD